MKMWIGLTSNASVKLENVQLSNVLIIGFLLAFSVSTQARPGDGWGGDAQRCAAGGCGNNSNNNSNSNSSAPYVPSADEIAAQRGNAINDEGNKAYEANNIALAISLYEQAVRIKPNDASIAKNLKMARAALLNEDGLRAFNADNWDLAVSLFEQGLRISPSNTPYLRESLTHNLSMARAMVHAQQEHEAAVLRQEQVDAINKDGLKAEKAGNWTLAVKLYEQALRISPKDPNVASNLKRARGGVLNDAGTKAFKLADYALAVKLYERGLQINPNDTNMANNLKLAREAKANEAANLRQARVNAINKDGLKAEKAGNWALAAEFYAQALRLNPNDTDIVEDLKRARAGVVNDAGTKAFDAGNYTLAEKLYAQSLQIDPDAVVEENLKGAREALAKQREDEVVKRQAQRDEQGRRQQDKIAAAKLQKGTSTGVFGTTSNPSNPDLGLPVTSKQQTTYKSASEQADAAVKDKDPSCVFDGTAECAKGVSIGKPVESPWAGAQSPAAFALANLIGKYEQTNYDPLIAKSLKWYLSLDRQVLEKQAQIATVQKEIDSGKGDPKILNVQKESLKNEVTLAKHDQTTAVNQIKEQNKKLNLGLDFPPDGSGTAK